MRLYMVKVPFETTKLIMQHEMRRLNEAIEDKANGFRVKRLESQLDAKVDGLMQLTVLQKKIAQKTRKLRKLKKLGIQETKGDDPKVALQAKISDLKVQYIQARNAASFHIEDL